MIPLTTTVGTPQLLGNTALSFCASQAWKRKPNVRAMQIKPFRIEHYFAKHEFSARYLSASSDAESRSIQEVLDLGATLLEKTEIDCVGHGLIASIVRMKMVF